MKECYQHPFIYVIVQISQMITILILNKLSISKISICDKRNVCSANLSTIPTLKLNRVEK